MTTKFRVVVEMHDGYWNTRVLTDSELLYQEYSLDSQATNPFLVASDALAKMGSSVPRGFISKTVLEEVKP